MSLQSEPANGRPRFETGDEVIGDGHLHGVIVETNIVHQPAALGHCDAIREYVVKNEKGEKFLYAGEANLQLVRKGLGDAAPPRPEFMKELEDDLKRRPLLGLRP